jgi:hypothetical protein
MRRQKVSNKIELHENDLPPKVAKAALEKLLKSLPKLSGEEAHDQLISILMRCMYSDEEGNFLWAHDLPIVRKIIKAKPAVKKLAFEWLVEAPE